MLVPHRSGLVSDSPGLFREREGLSMLKSLRWLPAVVGVNRTSVDAPAKRAGPSISYTRLFPKMLRPQRRTVPLLKTRHGLRVPTLIQAFTIDPTHPLYRRERVVLEVL